MVDRDTSYASDAVVRLAHCVTSCVSSELRKQDNKRDMVNRIVNELSTFSQCTKSMVALAEHFQVNFSKCIESVAKDYAENNRTGVNSEVVGGFALAYVVKYYPHCVMAK